MTCCADRRKTISRRFISVISVGVIAAALCACDTNETSPNHVTQVTKCLLDLTEPVLVPASQEVSAFRIDPTEVTNAAFSAFVEQTGYQTLAERGPDRAVYPGLPDAAYLPGSAVFQNTAERQDLFWWSFVEGASWRAPEGPGSNLNGRAFHPVVHIAYEDAEAYAQWAGGDLPTAEEWEYAARGGLLNARYEWGDEHPDTGQPKANTWQGVFPLQDEGRDGFSGTAPVGCFRPNGYGLYDMTGNVWEWTKDETQLVSSATGLVKGGSFLCSQNYCARFHPAAYETQERHFSASHIGFRLVYRD